MTLVGATELETEFPNLWYGIKKLSVKDLSCATGSTPDCAVALHQHPIPSTNAAGSEGK